MVEYGIGILLCWMAWYTGEKVKRGVAARLPGSSKVRAFIWISGNAALTFGTVSFFYSFFVFSWWIPIMTLFGAVLLSGFLYVKLEKFLTISVVSVPVCGLAGAAFLGFALIA